MRSLRFATLVVLAAGCSPAVQSAFLVPEPPAPRATQTPIRIYADTRPECSFQEIGTVSAYARAPRQSPEDVTKAMRNRAQQMGGDAIVRFESTEVVNGAVVAPAGAGSVATVSSNTVYKGTVIRFRDPNCHSQPEAGRDR